MWLLPSFRFLLIQISVEEILGSPLLVFSAKECFRNQNFSRGRFPCHVKLLKKMLKGTKYEDIKLFGCVISHLKDDTQYDEYKVPQDVIDIIMDMDMKKYL
jgi:hypothetical protein